jgi:hypothetical protein
MSCDIKNDRTEIERCGREVLLAKIFYSSGFFDFTSDRGPVVSGYIEFFNNKEILTNCKVRRKLAKR